MNEHTSAQLKETMMGYDKACRAWTPESVLKSLQGSTSSDQGPQPMEVDRIETKARGSTKARTRTRARAGGTMAVLVQELLEEDVAKAEVMVTKARGKERPKENPSQKARMLARKAKQGQCGLPAVQNLF